MIRQKKDATNVKDVRNAKIALSARIVLNVFARSAMPNARNVSRAFLVYPVLKTQRIRNVMSARNVRSVSLVHPVHPVFMMRWNESTYFDVHQVLYDNIYLTFS